MRRAHPCCLLAAIIALIAALAPAVGQASTITLGSTDTSGVISTTAGSKGTLTLVNLTLAGPGTAPASPVDGAVVRWRLTGASGGPFYLRVLRPVAGAFAGAGTSGPATPAGMGTETFTTDLPIHRGDLIGFNTSNASDEVGAVVSSEGTYAGWEPALPDGTALPPTATAMGALFSFSADVQPAPTVTTISPASGSITGGTSVTIAGTDLTGVTSVQFGETPASIFPGGSDTQITAIAPKVKSPGPLGIAVVTNAGRSVASPGATFTYTACLVPKLKGRGLGTARRKLKKAGCKLGRVTGDGKKVIGQSARPKKVLPLGRKVNIKLG